MVIVKAEMCCVKRARALRMTNITCTSSSYDYYNHVLLTAVSEVKGSVHKINKIMCSFFPLSMKIALVLFFPDFEIFVIHSFCLLTNAMEIWNIVCALTFKESIGISFSSNRVPFTSL